MDNEGEVAAVILEPVMMNVGIIEPQPGYLQALRDACEKHGAVLIYDEVKCGGTIAYGGTMERYGVKPHLAAFAKAIGGGSTMGAFGGEARFMEFVTKGAAQQGTFNGNPLSSAAGVAALTEVLTRDAYDHLGKLGSMLAEGCDRAIAGSGIRPTPWTWARRAACPTGQSGSRTTATSWRRTRSCTGPRTPGWSTAGSS